MTDASSVIARLRELRERALKGDWIEEDDGIIAPDEATAVGSPWVAISVHHACRPAIVAALNAQEALLNVAEEAARVCYAMEANTADGAPEDLRAALAALAKVGGAE